MKVTNKIRNILNRLANNALENRRLNTLLNAELEQKGIDINDEEFIACMSYVEGDGDVTQILAYLENM